MHTDARYLDGNSVIEGDICIAGAGPAGITIGVELIDTRFKVILLEGGGFEPEARMQQLYDGETTGQSFLPLTAAALHYFGGTSNWGGMCSILDPWAFEKREWVDKSGWPISQSDLLPYYERANPYLDLGEYSFDLKYWQTRDSSLIELPLDKEVFWNKIWRFSSPPTRFGDKYKNRIVNAKNIHLFTYANVVDIRANENGSRVTEVTVRNYTGKTHKVKAKYFILACSGIQNARVLLAANKQFPNGLGNGNGLVGRYFNDHLDVRFAHLWLKDAAEFRLYTQEGKRPRAELAIMPHKQAEHEILIGNISFRTLGASEIGYLKRIEGFVKSGFNRKLHRAFETIIRLEQAPNPTSRITLAEEKDELGVSKVRLNWALTSLEAKSIRKIYGLLAQQVSVEGIGRLRICEEFLDQKEDSIPTSVIGGMHQMGSTRMSSDPNDGVVDATCRLHDIQNLYIAGSSCFPTGGAVNPTLTIVALSIRIADHLKNVARADSATTPKATVSGLLFGRSRQAAHEAVPLALYADCGVI
jgi:choline dehydrogenase-like flavoprotein